MPQQQQYPFQRNDFTWISNNNDFKIRTCVCKFFCWIKRNREKNEFELKLCKHKRSPTKAHKKPRAAEKKSKSQRRIVSFLKNKIVFSISFCIGLESQRFMTTLTNGKKIAFAYDDAIAFSSVQFSSFWPNGINFIAISSAK